MEKSAKEVINKVLDNGSTKEEAILVADWLASSMEGQACLSELIDRDSYFMEEELIQNNAISPSQSNAILSRIEKDIQKKTIKRSFFKFAAILLPFILVVGLGFYLNSQVNLFGNGTYSEIYVPKGENMRILFQDGSEAYLNSDTKLRYPDKFGLKNRKVFLQGEAYFNISSNKRRPFIVNTGSSEIVVLGTSFNVNAYEDEKTVQVVLDEGAVAFETRHNKYEIVPGQKIEYDKTIGTITISNLKKSNEASLWKSNIVNLTNTSLTDVLNLLSRRYNVTFKLADTSVLKYTYTLTTRKTTIEDIIGELEKIAPVKFKKEDFYYSVGM